jgi:putrescine transport system permease protein
VLRTPLRFLENNVGRIWMGLVYLFLYIPLMFLIVFSFNSTRQDGVFTGFSLRWYEALLSDSRLVEGFFLSLKVALITGTLVGGAGQLCRLCAGALFALYRAHACSRAW